jgi:hypothetical protein
VESFSCPLASGGELHGLADDGAEDNVCVHGVGG